MLRLSWDSLFGSPVWIGLSSTQLDSIFELWASNFWQQLSLLNINPKPVLFRSFILIRIGQKRKNSQLGRDSKRLEKALFETVFCLNGASLSIVLMFSARNSFASRSGALSEWEREGERERWHLVSGLAQPRISRQQSTRARKAPLIGRASVGCFRMSSGGHFAPQEVSSYPYSPSSPLTACFLSIQPLSETVLAHWYTSRAACLLANKIIQDIIACNQRQKWEVRIHYTYYHRYQ